MGVCYPSPPNLGQFRLCVDTQSPRFRVEMSGAKTLECCLCPRRVVSCPLASALPGSLSQHSGSFQDPGIQRESSTARGQLIGKGGNLG